MSAPNILPGQFYKAISRDDAPPQGWTVLSIASGYLDQGTSEHGLARVWVIRNDTRTATPELRDYPILQKSIQCADWVPTDGPFKPVVPVEDLPEAVRTKITTIEEHRYQLISPVLKLGDDAFWPHVRREALKKRAAETGKSVDHLWQLLCLYWQFGGRRGLRPRAVLAGQKSLAHRMKTALESARAVKTGKASPADFFKVYKTGPKTTEVVPEGKPMEFADVVQCQRGALKYLHVPSKDGKRRFEFEKAYLKTLSHEYSYVKDGSTVPTRPVPSYDQFVVAAQADPRFQRLSARIVGPMTAVRSHRQKKESTQDQVLGPGHVLQIDDMDLKVTVVSAFNRLPIGRARCFVATDQWSGLLVGAHETLAGSGFEGVRELLVNVATPKDVFLREQGYDKIDPRFFPGHGVFAVVDADNGPLRARLGDILPQDFTSLASLPVARGDLKPDIESSFHSFLRQVAQDLPGFTRVERNIGLPNSDTDASLTMAELRRIIWAWMAAYNARPRDDYLPESLLQLEDNDRPENTPYQLFPSGLIHCSGKLRFMPEDQIRRSLLRAERGTLTGRNGIRFRGLHYFIDDGEPYRFKSEAVDIRYSENSARRIYVWLNRRCHVATLGPSDMEKFGDKSFPEIDKELKQRRTSNLGARSLRRRVRVGSLNQIVAETVASAQQELRTLYPNERLRKQALNANSKSSNRERDRTAERRTAADKDAKAFPAESPKAEAPVHQPSLKKKSLRELLSKSTTAQPTSP